MSLSRREKLLALLEALDEVGNEQQSTKVPRSIVVKQPRPKYNVGTQLEVLAALDRCLGSPIVGYPLGFTLQKVVVTKNVVPAKPSAGQAFIKTEATGDVCACVHGNRMIVSGFSDEVESEQHVLYGRSGSFRDFAIDGTSVVELVDTPGNGHPRQNDRIIFQRLTMVNGNSTNGEHGTATGAVTVPHYANRGFYFPARPDNDEFASYLSGGVRINLRMATGATSNELDGYKVSSSHGIATADTRKPISVCNTSTWPLLGSEIGRVNVVQVVDKIPDSEWTPAGRTNTVIPTFVSLVYDTRIYVHGDKVFSFDLTNDKFRNKDGAISYGGIAQPVDSCDIFISMIAQVGYYNNTTGSATEAGPNPGLSNPTDDTTTELSLVAYFYTDVGVFSKEVKLFEHVTSTDRDNWKSYNGQISLRIGDPLRRNMMQDTTLSTLSGVSFRDHDPSIGTYAGQPVSHIEVFFNSRLRKGWTAEGVRYSMRNMLIVGRHFMTRTAQATNNAVVLEPATNEEDAVTDSGNYARTGIDDGPTAVLIGQGYEKVGEDLIIRAEGLNDGTNATQGSGADRLVAQSLQSNFRFMLETYYIGTVGAPEQVSIGKEPVTLDDLQWMVTNSVDTGN